MFAAGSPLLSRRQHSVVPRAVPSTFDRRRVQTGPTGHSGPATLMAGSMVIAKTAFYAPCLLNTNLLTIVVSGN